MENFSDQFLLGGTVFRMQSWSRFEATNVGFRLAMSLSEVSPIKDALDSSDLANVCASVIEIRSTEEFESRGVRHSSTFVLIGDQSSTTYLVVIDLARDSLLAETCYEFTKVRKRRFNNSFILTTTIDTAIVKSNAVRK